MRTRWTLITTAALLCSALSLPAAAAPLGTVVNNSPLAPAIPVGIEHDGAGNLWLTSIGIDDAITLIDTSGVALGPGFLVPQSTNPIGVTVVGAELFVTDTGGADVDRYSTAGAYQGSFSVSGQTTFPEGVTYNPFTNSLYVVDGTGANAVHQYSLAGALIGSFAVAGSSLDGIAFDPLRNSFWLYDSGTDMVRHYSNTFVQLESFAGTAAAGFGTGEGLAVIGNRLFVVATGTRQLVEFDISMAQGTPTSVPEPGTLTLAAFALGGLLLRSRRRTR